MMKTVEGSNFFRSSAFARRFFRFSGQGELVSDTMLGDGLEIQFVRWKAGPTDKSAAFTILNDATSLQRDDRMGAILTKGADCKRPLLWHPPGMLVGRQDRHKRIANVAGIKVVSWWEVSGSPTLHIELSDAKNAVVYWPMVVFDDSSPTTVSDIVDLTEVERQRFIKSDWFDASSPADLWKYFVQGSVYDPRDAGRGRFRCQQCAYAWWSYLMALHRRTEKTHYRALASAIAWSVCVDLGADGSWRHGFWNEEPEIHARMFWDGVRLLLAENEVAPHPHLVASAEKATEFAVREFTEKLDGGGLWFLHDSDEGSKPLQAQTTVVGRSLNNSLCLNTHIQALVVLSRLRPFMDNPAVSDELYARGLRGLGTVLGLECGNRLLHLMDRFLPQLLSWKVPCSFAERLLRFVFYRLLKSRFWWVRNRSRCLVFPSGYIDRDLGRTMLADEYHVVNLKDLAELNRLDPQPWLEEVIARGCRFVVTLDYERALERNKIWAEWVDVLAICGLGQDIDSVRAEESVSQCLGGRPLDAFCVASGVWHFRDAG